MKADFTRDTFYPFKHFARVLMQQGRVQLDADWNEQAAILLRYLRSLAADLIGPEGGPEDSSGSAPAFLISPLNLIPAPPDFQIGPGHYYVDGILCEAEATPVSLTVVDATNNVVEVQNWMPDGTPFDEIEFVEVFDAAVPSPYTYYLAQVSIADPVKRQLTLTLSPSLASLSSLTSPWLRRAYTYLTQPDLPSPPALTPSGGAYQQVYLDVWERHITYVEDDAIREVALGGPDTATRAKVVWQVRLTTACGGDNRGCCAAEDFAAKFQPENRGWLKAQVEQAPQTADPCIVSPTSRYRGPENQLYRVEIHTGSFDSSGNPLKPTFKYSRENGAVVFPITRLTTDSTSNTTTVYLENLGRDDRFDLAEGDWVEVQDDDSVLLNQPDKLLVVQSIDRTTVSATLAGRTMSTVGADPTKHPLLRRWDQKAGDPAENGLTLSSADNAALIAEGNWQALENGVQIEFQPADDPNKNTYRTGDYWLIPARTATGNVEWPTVTPKDSQGNPIKDTSGNPVVVPVALPPRGVLHHYAPLALITFDGNNVTFQTDCRSQFQSGALLAKMIRRAQTTPVIPADAVQSKGKTSGDLQTRVAALEAVVRQPTGQG